jgi:hypothetical protein
LSLFWFYSCWNLLYHSRGVGIASVTTKHIQVTCVERTDFVPSGTRYLRQSTFLGAGNQPSHNPPHLHHCAVARLGASRSSCHRLVPLPRCIAFSSPLSFVKSRAKGESVLKKFQTVFDPGAKKHRVTCVHTHALHSTQRGSFGWFSRIQYCGNARCLVRLYRKPLLYATTLVTTENH